MSSLLDQLNQQQREAVEATEGPVLVLAGAGSGKTRVLTHRAAHLVRGLGVRPDEIVAVTFTNKAAGEMKERIAHLLGGDPGGLRMGTFHSLCLRILRVEAGVMGWPRDFVVFDSADQTALMKEVAEDLRLAAETHPPRLLLQRISGARNRHLTPEAVRAALAEPGGDLMVAVHDLYRRKLRAAAAMDFDDLILNVLLLFREQPDLRLKHQQRTRYLMVDEFQDTNRPQYALVQELSGATRNLCVVGDDAQSIYRFRGAEIGNILTFQVDYPDARAVMLTRNYRSTGRILEAAGRVIARNRARLDKELWTSNPQGDRLTWLQAATDRDEAAFVVDQIRSLRRGQPAHDLGDVAVLYRTNAQSRLLEEALVKAGLPYRIFGGLRFYDRKEVKDLIAYLRAALNPADEVSLRRILNVPPRGLGRVTLDAIEEAAKAEGITLRASVVKAAAEEPPRRSTQALRGLVDLLDDLRERALGGAPAGTLLSDLIRRIGYEDHLRGSEPEQAESRLENVGQLVAAARDREAAGEGEVQAFLDGTALVADVESVQGDTGVSLMTIHCAKGLEFPVVFLVGMEENLFPHLRSTRTSDPEEIEEERRLCYVGMTRARQRLILTCARQRRSFGSMAQNEPSRFVAEIGHELLEDLSADWMGATTARPYGSAWDAGHHPPRRSARRVPELGEEDVSEAPEDDEGAGAPGNGDHLKVGMRVFHEQFGYGKVESLEGRGEKRRAVVRFPGRGRTTLVLAFAPLRPVSP